MIPTSFPYHGFGFKTQASGIGKARLGWITTPHGEIPTPNFIFCATRACLKGVPTHMLRALNVDVVLGNTYHLMLRPTGEVIAHGGGLGAFMGWNGPTLTDSGGFQIFSLGRDARKPVVPSDATASTTTTSAAMSPHADAKGAPLVGSPLIKITEEGALMRSIYDGHTFTLTPERSIAAQGEIGADLVVILDECTDHDHNADYLAQSLARTHRWSDRSLAAFIGRDGIGSGGSQALYGVIQGGTSATLRQKAVDYVNSRPFFGCAIGGTLGDGHSAIQQSITRASRGINPSRPLHLLGIGDLKTIWQGVLEGVDTFDCVGPSRVARHGWALTRPTRANPQGRINLRNSHMRDDSSPIEPECTAPCCTMYTRRYIAHLTRVGESLGGTLLTVHNTHLMTRFMCDLRTALGQGNLDTFQAHWGL